MSTNGDGWKRYPRPVYTDPGQIDADIRNGTFARKTRVRPALGRVVAAIRRTAA